MKWGKSFFFLLLLIIIPNCATLHDKLLTAQPGMSKTEVMGQFGRPDETSYDTHFTYWIYHTEVKNPNTKQIRKWHIHYAFQGATLIKVEPKMVPTPTELQSIEEQAQEKIQKLPENGAPPSDEKFKEL